MIIKKATSDDIEGILDITKKSFALYRDELPSHADVAALSETAQKVEYDILNNTVFVACDENQKILGSIRYEALSDNLAYIYRFGVDPQINNTGIGSALLEEVINDCKKHRFNAIALHTNSKYYRLARYYYGKGFYVHSTNTDKGYIRALFILELNNLPCDFSPAFKK